MTGNGLSLPRTPCCRRLSCRFTLCTGEATDRYPPDTEVIFQLRTSLEESMSNDRITRIPAPAVPGISDSTRVTSGDLVFISGQVGFEADGSVPESP